jgi:hypothetical protein
MIILIILKNLLKIHNKNIKVNIFFFPITHIIKISLEKLINYNVYNKFSIKQN